MKKKVILIVSVLIVVSMFFMLRSNGSSKTIEEAINPFGTNQVNIIHEEKNDKGSIVFSYNSSDDSLSTVVVRKTIGGYKAVYSGVHGDIKMVSEMFGLSNIYFPAIEKTELPVYFGLIGDPDISKVKIIEKKRNAEGEAKIINANGTRIWLIYMNQFEGSDFDIIGLSKDNKELVKIDGNISPYYAEQKPFEGYE
jgi:hypothetical protein